MNMKISVTHDRKEESVEQKVRWFKSLSLSERMDILCEFTEFALTMNPNLMDKDDAQQTKRSIQIVSAT